MNDVTLAKRYIKKAERAKEKGLEFSLSFSKYKQLSARKTCTISGITLLDQNTAGTMPNNRTLDRLDNNIGYTDKNTIAVASFINGIKGVLEDKNNVYNKEVQLKHIAKMVKYLAKTNLDL